MEQKVNKGTTTIGLVCSDGVVMGTEMRATMGNLISHKTTQKIFQIDDHLAMTVAGLVGDAQALARWLSAEAELYKTRRGAPMSVSGAATVLSNIMHGNKFAPYYVQLLVGGVDQREHNVFSLDAAGGCIPDNIQSTGSGSPFAYGVLEDGYNEELTVEEGLDLGIRALTSAMRRDSASGDNIAIASITRDAGYVRLSQEDLDARRTRLGLL